MKQSCVFILIFHLVFIIQYAASETYKEWYTNTVRNCTPGSTVKYYKPNKICKCSQPGVIDSCHFIGIRDNPAIGLRGQEWKPKQPCSTLAGPFFDGCNWCGCDGGKYSCTKNPCLKKLKGSQNVFLEGTLNINTFGPEKCPAQSYLHEDGCNWCTCTSGWAFCTVRPCPKKKPEVNKCINNPHGGFYADDGCNWCTCAPDNTAYCTNMGCKKEEKQSIEAKCANNLKGGYLHDDGCNWCNCTRDKSNAICTDHPCNREEINKPKQSKCANNLKGGYLHDDGCNWCTCKRDKSNATCTDHPCNGEKNKKPKKSRNLCKGKWWGRVLMPDGCNTCACLFGQSSACTIMTCPEPVETLPEKPRNLCKGKWWSRVLMPDGCNTCACRFGELTACTTVNCAEPVVTLTKKLSSSVCKNGSRHVKPDACNVCLCDNSGVAICTVKYCYGKKTGLDKKKYKQKQDSALLQDKKHNPSTHKKKLYALKERAQSCKVGEKFRKPLATCNWCTCIENGVVTCDMEVCDDLRGRN